MSAAELKTHPVTSLLELNSKLWAWLELSYHRCAHRGLDSKSPFQAWEESAAAHPVRSCDPKELYPLFLWSHRRRVDKSGCVSLFGNHYRVELAPGEQAELRYDPFDLSKVLAYDPRGRPVGQAIAVDLTHLCHPQVTPPQELPQSPASGLDYLELLLRKQEQEQRASLELLRFSELLDAAHKGD